MGWFNYYGLAIILIIMAPNIVYAIANKTTTKNDSRTKAAEIL